MKYFIVADKAFEQNKTKRYKNQAGYLVLPNCYIARSGIVQYSDVVCDDGGVVANGDLISVYRPPEAIKAMCKKFSNLPLTKTHPKEVAVTPENAKEVVVGALGSNPRYEEIDGVGYAICDIIVYDIDAIEAIEKGEYEELSAGHETAFRRERGVTPDGEPYEAVQYYMSPNHVALVQRGRCGSSCKVCDHSELNTKTKEITMRKKKIASGGKPEKFRYLLQTGDGEEGSGKFVELTEEQAKQIMENDPDLEVEETTDEDVELEEMGGEEENESTEEGLEGEEENESTEGEEPELVYEVQFDDGSVGKMDEVTYKQVQRFLDVQKTGDSKDKVSKGIASLALLTTNATKVLGDEFDLNKFVKGDAIDEEGIKKAIIKKAMPRVVQTKLRGDSLDQVYQTAVLTFQKDSKEWQEDVVKIGKAGSESIVAKVGDGVKQSPAELARKKFIDRMHGKKGE